jgi:glutathione S-transferase
MLTLYDFGNSVCCQKVRITMRVKGLTWDSVKVDLFRAEQYDPKYLKLNPKGIVPTLVHDGKPIIESTLICEYLDDTFPEPRLIPSDPWQRTRMRLWSKMVDEGLFEGVTELSFSAMFRERMRNMPEEIRERRFRNIGDPHRRDRFMSTYELGVRSPYVKHGIAAYERAFKLLEDTLTETGPWILGANPSLADINLMPFAARLDYLGLRSLDQRGLAARLAELQNWMSRSNLRGRIVGDANAWAQDCGRRRRDHLRGATERARHGALICLN